MGCNCKVSENSSSRSTNENVPVSQTIVKYTAKIIGFLLGILLLPLIVLGIIWFMFDIIVLNKDVDLSILLKKIIKVNKALMSDDEDEEDDDDDYEITEEDEDDYITENVEEIK